MCGLGTVCGGERLPRRGTPDRGLLRGCRACWGWRQPQGVPCPRRPPARHAWPFPLPPPFLCYLLLLLVLPCSPAATCQDPHADVCTTKDTPALQTEGANDAHDCLEAGERALCAPLGQCVRAGRARESGQNGGRWGRARILCCRLVMTPVVLTHIACHPPRGGPCAFVRVRVCSCVLSGMHRAHPHPRDGRCRLSIGEAAPPPLSSIKSRKTGVSPASTIMTCPGPTHHVCHGCPPCMRCPSALPSHQRIAPWPTTMDPRDSLCSSLSKACSAAHSSCTAQLLWGWDLLAPGAGRVAARGSTSSATADAQPTCAPIRPWHTTTTTTKELSTRSCQFEVAKKQSPFLRRAHTRSAEID